MISTDLIPTSNTLSGTTLAVKQCIDTIVQPEVCQDIVANSGGPSTNNIGIAILFVGLLIFSAHLFAAIFSRRRIPDVLFLIIIGLLIGPIFHWVQPSDLGSVGSIFTSLTLIIILFETGTQLDFSTLATSLRDTLILTVISFFITFLSIGLIGWLLLHYDPTVSFMLGAVLGGTSSALVIPMVKQINISSKSSTIIILESAFNDVLCIVIALALLESFKLGKLQFGGLFGNIFASFVLATIIGILGAIIWAFLLDRIRLVKNSIFTTPAFVFIIYGISESLGYSGAISSLAFGIGMANINKICNIGVKRFIKKDPATLNDTEKTLFGELVFLMKTFFFVFIGISIRFDSPKTLLIGLGITILIFLLRILSVRLSFKKQDADITLSDRSFISVMTAKGLAAAVLATMIENSQIPGTEGISGIVYSVIFFSILITSILVPLIDRKKLLYRIYSTLLGHKDQRLTDIFDKEEEQIE